MGWTIPLQHAAYRGVRFDVITITDNIERAVVEHAYPFVDGADLEDMGRQPHQVQLQAVFFGKDYRIGLDKFMTALQQSGADVLVHPIFGRMPNMLCTSASIRHGDDFVDYATLDLTFIEATQLKPIFAFEQNLWSEIDRLINALETFEDTVIALYGQFMHSVALAHHAKTRMLRVWSALVGVYESTLLMFGVTSHQYTPSAGVHFQQFERDTVKVVKAIGEIIAQELANIAFPISGQSATKKQRNASTLFDETPSDTSSILTVKSRFDEVLREALLVKNLPQELVSGKNNSVKRASKLAALVSTFSYADMRETECAVQLMLATTIMRIGIEMIEAHADSLLPSDIEYIAQQSRLAIVEAIEMVRQLQKQDMTVLGNTTEQNTGVYAYGYQTIEQLRQLAHQVSQIALVAINRKPPLRVKVCPLTGTLQQVAHAFYGDYRRTEELLRLNPQIRHPNFIQQGVLINAYSK